LEKKKKVKPKVSFITGVKNRAPELKEMLQSLIQQDMPEWEAIIVDDHSYEPIEKVVKEFNDERLHYYRLPKEEKGICYGRNLAVSMAQAEIMLTADGDDISRSHRARTTYEIMTKNNCDVFYCNLEYFIAEENKKWTTTFQPFNAELFKIFNFVTNPGTAFKKGKFLEIGGFDPEFKLSEDYDLWLRMSNAGAKFCYTKEILVNYRRGPESTSTKNFGQMHEYIQKTRIKNHIPPFNIEDVEKYALPEIAKNILSEKGRLLWQDDRFKKNEGK